MNVRRRIGTVTVTEPFERTEYMETAAWYRMHMVQPGEYAVHTLGNTWDDPYYVTVVYDSVITAQHTPPLFGGVPIGPSRHDDEGKRSKFAVQEYAYLCPEGFVDESTGEWLGGVFTPVPGVTFEHRYNREGERYGTEPVLPDCLPPGASLTLRYRVAFHWYYRWGVPAYQAAAYARFRCSADESHLGRVRRNSTDRFHYSDVARAQFKITGARRGTYMPVNPVFQSQLADEQGWPSPGGYRVNH